MDYSKMTDFEINKRVFEAKSGFSALSYPHDADKRSCGHKDINGNYHWFDFCNNAADAWPIITGNKISLNHYSGTWEASWEYDAPVGAFGTDEEVTGTIGDSNPLRAAMQVYLQLQGAK